MPDTPRDMRSTLSAVSTGSEPAARRLMPVVYEELRSLAAAYFRRLPPGQTLEPTALVHEAFARLVKQSGLPSEDQAHFFAIAAKAMRGILVDAIRAKTSAKRGGGYGRLALSMIEHAGAEEAIDILALDDALTRLAKRNERQARVVELRFFGNMKVSDVALVLGVSKTTVEQDWRIARAWLSGELKGAESEG